jgi:hypothetical protein
VAVAVLVGLVPVPGFGAEQPYGGATPQELVARMRAAAETQDFGELMACMAPDDRKAMGGTMLMMAVMMVSFSQMGAEMGGAMAEGMAEAFGADEQTPEQKAEMEAQKAEAAAAADAIAAKLRAVLEPHGLAGLLDGDFEPGGAQDQEIEAALDRADMIAVTESVMGILAELKDAEEAEGIDPGVPDGLGPEGEGAPDWVDLEVTDYAIDGDHATAKAGDETLEMIRVDGRWYFAPQEGGLEMETPEPDDGSVDGR